MIRLLVGFRGKVTGEVYHEPGVVLTLPPAVEAELIQHGKAEPVEPSEPEAKPKARKKRS